MEPAANFPTFLSMDPTNCRCPHLLDKLAELYARTNLSFIQKLILVLTTDARHHFLKSQVPAISRIIQ